jgi:serine/threonine-protein kinase
MSEPEKLGKYEIRGVLGRGAMGVVYRAFDPHIERVVAIKTVRKDLLDADLAAQFMARFRNEAKAAGRLHHPNIVGIFEYGEEESIAYIAMEFVEGTGLRDFLNRRVRFDLAQVAAILAQLLSALELAHARGVVHRDIKPSNLILTPAGVLKVADFGIARIDASTLTQTGMVMGTPSYMSPEQCRGEDSDARTDLFSAGVVLYELLTGGRPFIGSVDMIAHRICHETPPPPSQVVPELPPAVDAVVATALAKTPAGRYASARAFLEALVAATGAAAGPGGEATLLNVAGLAPAPPAVSAAWDEVTLATIERQLAQHVGPMARVLVRKAAARAHDVPDLYALLAPNIDDDEKRRRFVEHSGATTGAAGGSGAPRAPGATGAGGTAGQAATGGGTRAGSGSRPSTAPQPLEPAFVQETTQRLAVYLGPIARIVARKAAEKARSPDEFVRLVADHIGTQDRDAFLREMGAGG